MIKVGIVGATGYTGSELLRLLLRHEKVELTAITSRKQAGVALASYFPNLRGMTDLRYEHPDEAELTHCDIVFFATPHGICMKQAKKLLDAGVKVIDLSADFRIRDVATFEKWYQIEHCAADLLGEAVYGLPEAGNREAVKSARLVANPGCYPTSMQIGLQPLLKANLIDTKNIIIDAKSGISGAGRAAKIDTLYAELDGNFKAYGQSGHRHLPETEQELSRIADEPVAITFVPHLIPMPRGIESTIYATLKSNENIHDFFERFYADEYFIDVMPQGRFPETRFVKGSNFIKVGVQQFDDGRLILSVVEDNLVKGAAGQAIQCMNIMCEIPETMGLSQIALMP